MDSLNHTFTGKIEIQQERKAPYFIEADITYILSPSSKLGIPKFTKIQLKGKTISLTLVTESSLIRAYAKHRSISL